MKKITKVILHNFKSHKHSEIPFENFTSIIGPTNSGKSAIVGGIKLCLYNEPSGKKFITHGEKLCYVEVQFDDGTKIRRTRGDGDTGDVNMYELFNSDGEVTTLNNFGSGAVDLVVAFHGMPKVNLFGGDESLNICNQFDSPFLLNESPMKRARMIGKMAKTDVADLALQNINSEIRKKKILEKEYKGEIKVIDGKLKSMKDLPRMQGAVDEISLNLEKAELIKNKLERIELVNNKINALNHESNCLVDIIKHHDNVENAIKEIDKLVLSIGRLNKVTDINNKLIAKISEAEKIQSLITTTDINIVESVVNDLVNISKSLNSMVSIIKISEKIADGIKKKSKLKNIVDISTDNVVKSIDECNKLMLNINSISSVNSKLKDELSRKDRGNKIIHDMENEYRLKVNGYKNKLKENKECPLCHSELDESRLETIEDYLM